MLAEVFNMYLKECSFPHYWKVTSVVQYLRTLGERSTAKNYRAVSLLSLISKISEKPVNNTHVDRLKKCDSRVWGYSSCSCWYIQSFHLFSVIDGFSWFWVGSLQNNIQLVLKFFNVGVFLHSWFCTFLTMYEWPS